MPGSELTEAVNPLEAGLYHAVSLSKGCYMGQETLAKVGSRAVCECPANTGADWTDTNAVPTLANASDASLGSC